jgi:hypothetical protein
LHPPSKLRIRTSPDQTAKLGNIVQRPWISTVSHGGGSPISLVYPAQRFVAPKVRAFIAVAEEMWKKE